MFIVVACIIPATVTFPLANDIKSRSSLWPIVAPLVTTLPILSVPPEIELVPTSILPNPADILPEFSAPTVTKLDVPAVEPKAASASDLVYLLESSVATFVEPILSVVASIIPSTTTPVALNVIRSLLSV